jgi:hypothetical protein
MIAKSNYDHEKAVAENVLIKSQLKAVTGQIQARKERKQGKGVIIKDQLVISVEEIVGKLIAHEEEIKEKQKQSKKRGRPRKQALTKDDENEEDESIEDV